VTVKGLGRVRIEGSHPTPEEHQRILALVESKAAPAPATEEVVAEEEVVEPTQPGVPDPTGLVEKFRKMKDPRSKRPWWEQVPRAYAATQSSLLRAPLSAGIALAEAAGYGAGDVMEGTTPTTLPPGMSAEEAAASKDVEVSPAAWLEQSWKEWEGDLYQPSEPSVVEAWGDVVDDPTRLGKFMAEGLSGSVPHYMAVKLAGPVRYAGMLIGDMARQRAERSAAEGEGDGKVTWTDLAVTAPAAAAISGLNAAAQSFGLSAAATQSLIKTMLRTAAAETSTEVAQSAIETAATGGGREEFIESMAAAATLGPAMGPALGLPAAAIQKARGRRADPRKDAPPPIEEVAAETVEEVTAEDVVTPAETVEEVQAPTGPSPAEAAWRLRLRLLNAGLDLPAEATLPAADVVTETAEEVTAEPVGPPFDPEASLEEYRRALDGRDPDPAEDIRTIEAILQRPGAGPWLGNMRNMALGRLEGDPFSERLRHGANRAEELWHQRRATPPAEVVTETVEEVQTPDLAPGEPSPEEATVEAVEVAKTDEGKVTGYYDQLAPPPLPIEAGPEVPAVDIVKETTTIVEDIEDLREQVKAIRAQERKVQAETPKRPVRKKRRTPRKKGRKLKEAERKLRELGAVEAASDLSKPVVDVLDAAVESVASGDQDVMRAANADVYEYLKSMGRTPEQISNIMRSKAAGYAETLQAMRDSKLETTVDDAGTVHMSAGMSTLVNNLLEQPYQVSGIEQTALLSGLVQSQKAWSDTTRRIGELDAKEAANPVERNAIEAEISKLDAKRREISETGDKIARANTLAGTRTSEAFKARQWGVDSEMTLFQARAKARGLKGSKLDPKEAEFIDKEFADADKLIAEAAKAKAEADKKLKAANKKLLAAVKDLKRAQGIKEATAKVAKKTKPKEARKKARKQAAEDLIAVAEGKPIRVTPIKPSAREKAARKAFKEAQKKVKAAMAEVADAQGERVKAESKDRDARSTKRKAPEEAIKHWAIRGLKEFWNATRTSVASLDVSALMRQGAVISALMPRAAARSLRHAWGVRPRRGDADRAYAYNEQRRILDDPMQKVRDWAGLEITEVEGQTNVVGGPAEAREEMYLSDVFRSGVLGATGRAYDKGIITPSQNSFGLMLNDMRTQLFDTLVTEVAEGRGAGPNATPEQIMSVIPKADAEALAVVINASTGRGRWLLTSPEYGAVKKRLVNILNPLVKWSLFAPRHSASRWEIASHLVHLFGGTGPFKNVSKPTLNLIRKKAMRVLGTWLTLGALGILSAGEIGDEELSEEQRWERKRQALENYLNPTHADFGKVRIGDHHIDVTGGTAGTNRMVLGAMLAVFNIGRRHDPEPSDEFGRLIRNKLHPVASAIYSMASNEDYIGRELGDPSEAMWAYVLDRYVYPAAGMITPITIQSIAEAASRDVDEKDIAVLDHVGAILADTIGMADQVYDPDFNKGKRPKRRKRAKRPRRERR